LKILEIAFISGVIHKLWLSFCSG